MSHLGKRSGRSKYFRLPAVGHALRALTIASMATASLLASVGASAAGWVNVGPANGPLTALSYDAASGHFAASRAGQLFTTNMAVGESPWKFSAALYQGSCVEDPRSPVTVVAVAGANGEQVTLDTCNRGVHFSIDGGESWSAYFDGSGTPLRLISTNPVDQSELYVYAPTGPKLLYSSNRFKSRIEVPIPVPGSTFNVDWTNRTIFAAAGGSVFRTVVGQMGPWTNVSTGLPSDGIGSTAGGGTQLYALTTHGLYVSHNQGGSWQLSLPDTVSGVAIGSGSSAYASAGVGLRKTTDAGQNWASLALPAGLAQATIYQVVVSSSPSTDSIFAATSLGYWQSKDGGQTFTPADPTSGLPGRAALGVVTNANRSNELYIQDATSAIGGSRTADGGTTWSYLTAPDGSALQPLWANGPIELATTVVPSANGYALWRTADSGGTWTHVADYNATNNLSSVFLAGADGATLYLFSNVFQGALHSVFVLKSTDSGATWTSAGSATVAGTLTVVRQRADTGEFFAVIGGSLWRTANLSNWGLPLVVGPPTTTVRSLTLSGSNPDRMYVGTASGTGVAAVYSTANGGSSWVPTSGAGLPPGPVSSLAVGSVLPLSVVAAMEAGGVFHSTDGGATWTNATSGLSDTRVINLSFATGGQTFYAATASGVLAVPGSNYLVGAITIEYYYPPFDHYFLTAFPSEIAALDDGLFPGWVRTGESYRVETDATAATNDVCRFFSVAFAPKSSHFFTPYTAECATVKASAAWQYEAVAFHLRLRGIDGNCPGGYRPYSRLYNNGAGGAPAHRYTVKPDIVAQMQAQGWVIEGAVETNAFACVLQ